MNVKLTSFEGPLDLLYHLIEKNEIDIYDIPIAELTDQYLEFLESHSMESMSEFIVMAAALLEIKSKMLLPLPKKDEPAIDPRQELVDKLIEYKRFKQAAEAFKTHSEFAEQYVFRASDSELLDMLQAAGRSTAEAVPGLLDGVTLDSLFDVFESVISRRELKTDKIRSGFNSVRRDIFTVDDKMLFIRELLSISRRISFRTIFDQGVSKIEKVVTFLALLELIKREEVSIRQDTLFADIHIFSGGGPA